MKITGYWGEHQTVFVDNVQGCRLTDCDGKEFVDFRLGYGPIILGYRDKLVDQAVIQAITHLGTISGFSTPMDIEVVKRIKALCPNIDKVRFANSGTEAAHGASSYSFVDSQVEIGSSLWKEA